MIVLEKTSEAPFIRNGLKSKALELRTAADMAHHRMQHNPHLRAGFEFYINAMDEAAALLESRLAEISS